MKKALIFGILGALFFAFTFVFNRSINLGGGYWLWSACLRYIFTLPLIGILVWKQHGIKRVVNEIKKNLGPWLLWSTVGFGMFYAPLTAASVYGESWFVAATWQLTIVAGVLLTPLFGKKIPVKNLLCSAIILVGIFLLQTSHFGSMSAADMIIPLLFILIGAFAYPLGNRKMMQVCPSDFTTPMRVFGMTLCSMPFWIILSIVSAAVSGAPSGGQVLQSFIVALFSGVVATVLFFEATNIVRNNPKQLAVIEATQSGEVVFTLIGSILFLGDPLPSVLGFVGLAVIVGGMILNSLMSANRSNT